MVARPLAARSFGRSFSTRSFADTFQDKVARYWTDERLKGLRRGAPDLALSPEKEGVATLLRVLGLMGSDARIGPDAQRKFHQVNRLLEIAEDVLSRPLRRKTEEPLRLLELCSGQSYLALIMAHAGLHRWSRPVQVLAVDRCPKRLESSQARAHQLGLAQSLRFRQSAVRELGPWTREWAEAFAIREGGAALRPPHAIFALHACNTATDEAIAAAVAAAADVIAVAPCCQAELGNQWTALERASGERARHPFALVHATAGIRHETAAQITDALRVALLQASGYAVTATAFVPAEHTPKNRLIVARRKRVATAIEPARVKALAERRTALAEHDALKRATGGAGISLELLLGFGSGEEPGAARDALMGGASDSSRGSEWEFAQSGQQLFQ